MTEAVEFSKLMVKIKFLNLYYQQNALFYRLPRIQQLLPKSIYSKVVSLVQSHDNYSGLKTYIWADIFETEHMEISPFFDI